MKELFYVEFWPDSQNLEDYEGYEDNCSPISDENLESYVINADWYDEKVNKSEGLHLLDLVHHIPTDKVGVIVGFPSKRVACVHVSGSEYITVSVSSLLAK